MDVLQRINFLLICLVLMSMASTVAVIKYLGWILEELRRNGKRNIR